jgi:hypothetical protein
MTERLMTEDPFPLHSFVIDLSVSSASVDSQSFRQRRSNCGIILPQNDSAILSDPRTSAGPAQSAFSRPAWITGIARCVVNRNDQTPVKRPQRTWPDENVGAASDRVILFLLTLMWL